MALENEDNVIRPKFFRARDPIEVQRLNEEHLLRIDAKARSVMDKFGNHPALQDRKKLERHRAAVRTMHIHDPLINFDELLDESDSRYAYLAAELYLFLRNLDAEKKKARG